MQFLDLKFNNFKSFREEQYIDFRKFTPGLYFIKGSNMLEPEMGSNGGGKSTILDALHWCLYGTSLRGTASTQLVPWGGSGNPSVSVRIKLDDIVTITRTHKPNTITFTRKGKETSITQEQLLDLIGLSSDTFQNSIIIGQFSRPFFNLKPREKMAVFAELLDLDYWEDCSGNARDTTRELYDKQYSLQDKVLSKDTLIKEIQRSIEIAREEEKDSAEVTKAEKKAIKKKRNEYTKERTRIKEKIAKHKKVMKSAKKDLEKADKEEKDLDRATNLAHQQLSSCGSNLQILNATLAENRNMARALKGAKGRCPSCGQKILPAHKRKELAKIEQATKDTNASIEVNKKEHKKWGEAYEFGRKELDDLLALHKEARDIINSAERDIDKMIYELDSLKKDIERCDEQIWDLENKSRKETSKIESQEKRLLKIKKQRRKVKRELAEISGLIFQTKYWVDGFKQVRLYEIGETLAALEVEINSYLIDLGMEGWSVHLDVERETKSGNISRGFQVMVDPGIGDHKSPRPWEVWSGGEGQRLALAGTLALSNLILKQFNRQSNLQFWDEKLVFLSGSGEEDMLELLRDIAIVEDKAIFIIDQHNLDHVFDGTISVIKDQTGSHIVI